MTDCAMYNISIGGYHPSTICIAIDFLPESLSSIFEVLMSPLIQESMSEFIQSFARTDEIMPSDRTLGFVIINSSKKVISLSFSELRSDLLKKCETVLERFRNSGFSVETDINIVN
ncbi:MAG: TA0956 family protein [Thermoplasmataceae archaeon]